MTKPERDIGAIHIQSSGPMYTTWNGPFKAGIYSTPNSRAREERLAYISHLLLKGPNLKKLCISERQASAVNSSNKTMVHSTMV